MLTEIANSQVGMANDFTRIKLLIPQENSQERRFPGTVSANKTDFGIVGDRGLGVVEKDLISVGFAGFSDLE